MDITLLQEHMEVVGSDGEHVGTIDHIEGDSIKLTKNDPAAQGQHHRIPLTWVTSLDGDTARLSLTAEQAHQQWQEV